MKVLFITNHFLGDNGGGSFASRAFINAFAELSDSFTLMYPDNEKNINSFINPKCTFIGLKSKRSSLLKLIDIYIGRINRFGKIGKSLISSSKPDLVVFDNSRASAGLIRTAKMYAKSVITIHHNYEMEYYSATKDSIFWRYPLMTYMKQTENEAVNLSTLNLTLTNDDSKLLRSNYCSTNHAKFQEIGCFEYRAITYPPLIVRRQDANTIRFAITGSLSDSQTENSLLPFINEYIPILRRVLPHSEVVVAGKNPSQFLVSACKNIPSLRLLPNPIDMQQILDDADVYLCPIDRGGGMKLRIMDGLRTGIPVLTHQISERGYAEFKDSGFLYSYSDKLSFELNLRELMKKYESGFFQGEAIRKKYTDILSFESGVERIRGCLSMLEGAKK